MRTMILLIFHHQYLFNVPSKLTIMCLKFNGWFRWFISFGGKRPIFRGLCLFWGGYVYFCSGPNQKKVMRIFTPLIAGFRQASPICTSSLCTRLIELFVFLFVRKLYYVSMTLPIGSSNLGFNQMVGYLWFRRFPFWLVHDQTTHQNTTTEPKPPPKAKPPPKPWTDSFDSWHLHPKVFQAVLV